MSAIAGFVELGCDIRGSDACALIAEGQLHFGPNGTSIESLTTATFAYNPGASDFAGRQPLRCEPRSFMLVADGRIDNRPDLYRALGLSSEEADGLSDAKIFRLAWKTWGEGCLDKMRGDFALAIWDAEQACLTLVRGPLSSRPIFYVEGSDFIAFASSPQALARLPMVGVRLDHARASAFLVRASGFPGSTFHKGIMRLEQGHLARSSAQRLGVERFWDIDARYRTYLSRDEYVAVFRHLFDRAVEARLRRPWGHVAAHLSGGRDSSAVAATAARLLGEEPLHAFTSAPREGFGGPVPQGLLADESGLATLTAMAHPSIDHHVCRPAGAPFEGIDAVHSVSPAPLGHITNHPWIRQIAEEARRSGASVLLTGEGGNFTVSAGGTAYFPALASEFGVGGAARVARGLLSAGRANLRSLIKACVGPYVPLPLYDLAMKMRGHGVSLEPTLCLLRSPYRAMAKEQLEAEFYDRRPPRDYMEFRKLMLFRREISNKWSLACWGLDWRDPTVDRDLVEFCLSLPADLLLSATSDRPLYEAAMSDRLPPEVLCPKARGYQGADWFEQFDQSSIREQFAQSAQHEGVRELLDVDHINGIIDTWPRSGWERRDQLNFYRNHVLAAVSLANFIKVNF